MAKKEVVNQQDKELYNDTSRMIQVDLEKEMRKSYLAYSMSVIVGRALPDVRDGLKPVHRRILYTMYERGLTPEKPYRKCADIVGAVLGAYHPHGDASVYDALVRLAQNFSLRYPLVDGHGNFGSVDGDPPAAYRYTEAKMKKLSLEMLNDIDKETVDFTSNYDDRLKEPVVLPARLPNLLINGSSGIAVGMATNIPPHNLKEVIDAACALIDDPDMGVADLMEYVKGPDFPTGGIIMGQSGIRAAYATGRGKITLRGRAEIEEEKNGRFRILITEIPYMVNKARLIQNMAELVKDKRIDGISDLRDETNREGMRIVVELKKDANPQIVLNQLYSFTQLQDTVGVIMLAIKDGQPREMTLKEILNSYIDFQCDIVVRRTRYNLRKAQERAHILEGLRIAIDAIDEVIRLIRSSKTIPESKEKLGVRFGLDDLQTSAIVAMPLGRLAGLEIEKIEAEYRELEKKIAYYQQILGDHGLVLSIVKDEIREISSKYKDERRTEIQAVSGEMDIEDLIPVEDCIITLTHYGYIKRQLTEAYRSQRRGGRGVTGMKTREEDFAEEMFVCSTHDIILFFTSKGRVLRLKGYEIPESSRNAKGTNIVNLLPLESGEKIMSMIRMEDFSDDKYLVFVTKNGIVKRTELMAYNTARKNGILAITVDEDDELRSVRLTGGDDELIIATRAGNAIHIHEQDIRPMGRLARGVRGINLAGKDDEVLTMARVREGATVLTVTEKGQGRRTRLEEYRLQARGGKGVTNYKTGDDKGMVAGVRIVDDTDDVIMITNDGVIIRIPVADIAVQSRYAGGVRVMRVEGESRIATIARAPHEEEEAEEDSAADTTPADPAESTQTEETTNE